MDSLPTLRPARRDDWPAIAALLRSCGVPLEGAQAQLSEFVVAVGADGIVGVAGMEAYGGVALLRSVAVAEGQRGKGLAGTLVAAVQTRARRLGVRHIYLLTTSAAAYFGRAGFAALPRAASPGALQASAEFRGACPESATFMALALS